MKLVKNLSKITLIAALACSFALTSCKKDEEKTDCGALANEVSVKGQAYISDGSVANCNAYKTALKAYIAGCNTGGADLAAFEASLDALVCE